MYFGELAEHSTDYQNGHSTGSVRAIDNCILSVETSDKEKWSKKEIIDLLKNEKEKWTSYCDTFGMGKEE